MGTLTMKFGGSTVGTTTALTQVVSIILQECERWDRLVIIASALDGVTDALIEAAHLASLANRRGYRRIVATIRTRHLALVEKLPLNTNERTSLQADIDSLLFDMLDVCQAMSNTAVEDSISQETVDSIIGVGERLSARIIAALIRTEGLRSVHMDTPTLIITDDHFGNATPDITETQTRIDRYLVPMLERKIIPVLTGFIGGTRDGKTTTLGRGGSDYTASIVATCIGAKEVWMWSDVDGMMSSDPEEMPDARVIPELSYDEVAELAYFGARILHAHMIGFLRRNEIPLRVKNVYKPQQAGTLIHSTTKTNARIIKAVTAIQGIGLRADHSGPLAEIHDLINKTVTEATGNPADVTISSQSSSQTFICLVIPTTTGPSAVHNTQVKLQQRLQQKYGENEWSVIPISIITTIGRGLGQNPAVTAQIFDVLRDIPVLAVSQGPTSSNLSIVVDTDYGSETLHRLHELTLNN